MDIETMTTQRKTASSEGTGDATQLLGALALMASGIFDLEGRRWKEREGSSHETQERRRCKKERTEEVVSRTGEARVRENRGDQTAGGKESLQQQPLSCLEGR